MLSDASDVCSVITLTYCKAPIRIEKRDPLSMSTGRQVRGLGNRQPLFSRGSASPWLCRVDLEAFGDTTLQYIPLAGRLPSPTIFLCVSGRRASITRVPPVRMERNQKIQRQPSFSASIPPNTGPKLGAIVVLGSR